MAGRWIESYVVLGSNVGNRKRNLLRAGRLLRKNREVRIKKSASIYETSSLRPGQRNYFNTALKIQTTLSPFQLLNVLKSIEKKMKRKKTVRWGPRNIDLDLIFYGKRKLTSRALTVPHPEFHKRKFVLAPLSEIGSSLMPVGFKKTVSELFLKLTDPQQKVRLVS